MYILVTRPLPEGERTAAALRARGHQALVASLMRVETIVADLAGDWSAVIITSANAVRAIAGRSETAKYFRLPLFVVGRRSAEAAREAGFINVNSADGDGDNLAELVAAGCKGAALPLLYLAGEDRAVDLEGELHQLGISVKTVVVYRGVTVPFPSSLAEALRAGAIDAVLHFSRRSAESYLAGARAAGLAARALSLRHLCLSAQVAEPLVAAGAAAVRVAKRPDEAAMLDLVESV
jgi:uroporphyrinogen-III synthase